MKFSRSTGALLLGLFILSLISLFIGTADLTIYDLFSGDLHKIEILLVSRIPRLLAILCTGVV